MIGENSPRAVCAPAVSYPLNAGDEIWRDHRESVAEHLSQLGYEVRPAARPLIIAALRDGVSPIEIAIDLALQSLALDVREHGSRADWVDLFATQAHHILHVLRDDRDAGLITRDAWERTASRAAGLGFANDLQGEWIRRTLGQSRAGGRRCARSRMVCDRRAPIPA